MITNYFSVIPLNYRPIFLGLFSSWVQAEVFGTIFILITVDFKLSYTHLFRSVLENQNKLILNNGKLLCDAVFKYAKINYNYNYVTKVNSYYHKIK